jgi:hypothetical protein
MSFTSQDAENLVKFVSNLLESQQVQTLYEDVLGYIKVQTSREFIEYWLSKDSELTPLPSETDEDKLAKLLQDH